MKYLSVCSGIEAASVAWHGMGWEPIAFSEIDPFASAVLAERFPRVPNLGNMEAYRDWPIEQEAADVLVGGTPCQSFSVAGLRKGLDDPRGNLALVYLGILEKYRPRWCVWENVPGVLSSNGGRDFGAFLGGLAQLGYGFAYRVLDAQFVRVESHPRAVPQRRRRVFVIGHSGGDWRSAASVLLEPEGVRGHSAPTRQEGSATWWNGNDVSQTLDAVLYKGQMLPEKNRFPVVAVGERWSSRPTATKTETVLPAESITQSARVLGRLRTTGMSAAKPECDSGRVLLRRVTPREVERLQGFPDDWTATTYRGKPAADGPRYKALGNSMAVNVMRWIGKRIARHA
jgi:DNA (cytosine-5)-methyltransferase 1